jgi:SPP1 gp7 family putative phage head morphogenesis protein
MPKLLSETLSEALRIASKKGADKALDALRKKGKNKVITETYDAISGEAHAKAFTVAKVSQMDILDDIFKEIESFKSNGKSVKEFKESLIPTLQKKGWWGKYEVTDPETGRKKTIQLGSESRIDTILRTNIAVAKSQARFKQQQKAREDRPYLIYHQQQRETKRKSHAKLDGKIFRADDPNIHKIYPPNGFGCHCVMRSLSERQFKNMGGKVHSVSGYLRGLEKSGDINNEDLDEMDRFDPRGTDFEKDMKKYAKELREQAKELFAKKPQYTKEELEKAKQSPILKSALNKTRDSNGNSKEYPNLTKEEKASLKALTNKKMKELILATGNKNNKVLDSYKSVLDTAIDKATKIRSSVYRGETANTSGLKAIGNKYKIGSIVEEANYILGSSSPMHGNVRFKYISNSAVDISDITSSAENRLIGRNKLFKVIDVKETKVSIIVTLEEVL